MKLPGTLEVVKSPQGLMLQLSVELFNALYARTGYRSKKARHKKKQVKKAVLQALSVAEQFVKLNKERLLLSGASSNPPQQPLQRDSTE